MPMSRFFDMRSHSFRIYVIVSLMAAIFIVYHAGTNYYGSLRIKEQEELEQLEGIARTLSLQTDGELLESVLQRFLEKDAIKTVQQDSVYHVLHQVLAAAHQINRLNSPIYTLSYNEAMGHFEFGVTSTPDPFYRHTYDSHPEILMQQYEKGGTIGYYEDEHGSWLSAFTPVRNHAGKVISVLMVDRRFDDFQADAKAGLWRDLLISLGIFAVMTLLLFGILRKVLDEEEQTKRMLEESREEIASQNDKITDSINYARHIQYAMMESGTLYGLFPDHFELFAPRDIVSGDFIWHFEYGRCCYIAVADCTGHGVPGALMSMLGMASLDEIVAARPDLMPHEVLTRLDQKIRMALRREGGTQAVQDGMDIAIVKIDLAAKLLHYAGAHNEMLYYQKGNAQVIKASRLPIGGDTRKPKVFETRTFELNTGDSIYLFTDGLTDQFGLVEGREEKFKTRRLLALIDQLKDQPMQAQGTGILGALRQWQNGLPQLDDMAAIGIRIP